MKISMFDHAKDNEPKPLEITWGSLTQQLGPHEWVTCEKTEVPAFSPAEFKAGSLRAAANVTQVWLFVADLDHLTEEAALRICQQVQAADLACILYTTYTHASDPWRLRMVLPLTRPVAAEDWPAFWDKMNEAFGGLCDAQCKDPSRLYFVPAAPVGTEAHNFYVVWEGNPIDVDVAIGAVRDSMDPDRLLAIRRLGEAWPTEGRHEAHLALSGGLLMSGVLVEDAVEIACRVAAMQDPNNEDREKRAATVEHTQARISAGERVVGWTTLAKHVPPDVVALARRVLEAPPKLALTQLKLFAKTLARKRDDAYAELGEALVKICDGDIYAEASNRSDVTLRLANLLGERFAKYSAASIADLFIPSLQRIGMTSVTCPSLDDIIFAIERRQAELKKKQLLEIEQQAYRIREAFNFERATPYNDQELKAFGDISKRWIIQYDRSFYLFFNGVYRGPYTEASVRSAMERELAPASSAGVQLHTLSKEGETVLKGISKLMSDYGSVAESVVLDMRAQTTTYNPIERCIIEAVCPVRPLKPVYHEDIARWLEILSGSHYENLKTWLALVPRLDVLLAALFLTGHASVGKSMLSEGASRVFTTSGPAELESLFSSFNDSVLSSPVVLADETLPKDFRGFSKNAQLRQHLQQQQRTVHRKYLPDAKLAGCTRTIIAAHDISILRTGERMSENEVQGLAERYFHIPTNPEAAAYLEQANTYERGWVYKDLIAEHILWLSQNHKHESQGRFYIKVPDQQVIRMLTTGSGVKSSVCEWFVSHLLQPQLFHMSANSNLLVRVRNQQLLANVRGVANCWSIYMPNERCPSTAELSSAIAELSLPEARPRLEDKDGARVNYRVIQLDNLYSWAENNGFATAEQIAQGLSKDTE